MSDQKRKLKAIRWLMICSQLLLVAFVLYWLVTQYRQEKVELNGLLKKAYLQTHEELMDTLLLQHVVMPSLADSTTLEIKLSQPGDPAFFSDSAAEFFHRQHFPADSSGKQDFVAIQLGPHKGIGTALQNQELEESISFSDSSREKLLVRSIKLFITETDSVFRSSDGARFLSLEVDSSSFFNQLSDTIRHLGRNFTLTWMDEKEGRELRAGSGRPLYIGRWNEGHPFEVRVSRFRGHLLLQILPQCLFALLLLGLSGASLLIAYRSLRKQMMLSQLRDDFIANISHELKTPVSTVKVALEALRNYSDTVPETRKKDYLEMARRENERLEKLVNKVLRNESLSHPVGEIRKEVLDLGRMLHGIASQSRLSLEESEASLELDLPDEPVLVEADALYLESALLNLVDNSLKYGGKGVRMKVRLTAASGGPLLTFHDNGPGIPEAYCSQIFDKFFRVPTGDLHQVKGHGLGLSFVKGLMEELGGSVSVRNEDGGGCTFSLQFPHLKKPGV